MVPTMNDKTWVPPSRISVDQAVRLQESADSLGNDFRRARLEREQLFATVRHLVEELQKVDPSHPAVAEAMETIRMLGVPR